MWADGGLWEKMGFRGCIVGESGLCSRAANRGGGAPPTPPLRLECDFGLHAVGTFRGSYDHTLDPKNRLTVPSRFRKDFKAAVLAKPLDLKPCVSVWRPDDYSSYANAAVAELPPLSPRRSDLERFLNGWSTETSIDAAGRVMVPGFLADHAKLKKDVVVVGVGNHLELWSREHWGGQQATLLESVEEITASFNAPA